MCNFQEETDQLLSVKTGHVKMQPFAPTYNGTKAKHTHKCTWENLQDKNSMDNTPTM